MLQRLPVKAEAMRPCSRDEMCWRRRPWARRHDVSAAKAGSFGNPDQPAEGASGTSRLRKRKHACVNENAPGAGVEAPRAQQLGLNDNLMAALPGATYMSAMQAMHKPISITLME